MIADARLAGLVTEEAGDNAVLHVAAHAGDDVLLGAQHHVAVGRAHDDHHPAGLDDGRRRDRDVGVHVGDRDRGAGQQAGPARGLGGQPAGLAPSSLISRDILSSTRCSSPGASALKKSSGGKPSCFDQMPL